MNAPTELYTPKTIVTLGSSTSMVMVVTAIESPASNAAAAAIHIHEFDAALVLTSGVSGESGIRERPCLRRMAARPRRRSTPRSVRRQIRSCD